MVMSSLSSGLPAVMLLLLLNVETPSSLSIDLIGKLADAMFPLGRVAVVCGLNRSQAHKTLKEANFTTLITSELTRIDILHANGPGIICWEDFGWERTAGKDRTIGEKHPWVVLHNSSANLEALSLRVSQRVYYVELETNVIRESYSLPSITDPFMKNLGRLGTDFKDETLLKRRSRDFGGLRLTAMTEEEMPFAKIVGESVPAAVTTSSGDRFDTLELSAMVGIIPDVMSEMSQEMNVSWKLYRREDRKWASLQPDGTFDGMISNLRKGEADIIAASLTNRADRQKAVDFLVAVGVENPGVFIKRTEVGHHDLDWTVYLDPFATPVWQILFIYCCLCSVVIQLVALAVQSNKPSCYLTQTVKELVYNYYIVFRSNLGGAPFPIQGDKTFQMKSLLFSIFFASNIVWMSYRASLTSELSSMKLKLPFSTLEELLQSNYRLIIKGGGSLHATFTGAKEGTIYHSLYRTYLEDSDKEVAFDTFEQANEALLKEKNVALYTSAGTIFSVEEIRCHVYNPWQSGQSNQMGFALPKGSPYFEFLQYRLLRLSETGVRNNFLHRHGAKDTRLCPGGQKSVQLGFEKLVSLFAVLAAGYCLACASCGAEMAACAGNSSGSRKRRATKATKKADLTARIKSLVDDAMDGLGVRESAEMAERLEDFVRYNGKALKTKY